MDENENRNEYNDENEEEKKEIEIVTGDGKDLEISPVYNHIKIDKTNNQPDKKQKIIIPEDKRSGN